MIALKILSKLFKALRSNQAPHELAWGFVLGMIVGLTPMWNLHNLIILILIIILRINAAMAIVGFLVFSLFAFFFDPLFHELGYWLLTDVALLAPAWQFFARTPVLALSNYNNTLVMGSFVVSIILVAPMFFLSKRGVVLYRAKIDSRVQKLKIVQIITGSKLYKLYQKISHLGE